MKKLYCLLSCFTALCASGSPLTSNFKPQTSNETAVADLGTVVVEGSALSKYRPEKVTGGTFTGEPPEKLPVVVDTLTEDFIRERNPTDLNDLLRWVPGIETGGTSLLPQTDRFFSESLQVEVEYFNPFSFVGVGPAVDGDALATDGALISPTIGLALHAAGVSAFTIDLLPPSIVEERAQKAKIPVLAAATGVLLLALAGGLVAMNHSSDVSAAVLESVKGEVNTLKGFEDGLKRADAAVDASKGKADALKTLVRSRSTPVLRLNAVRGALARGMWIEKWEENKVTIRGWKDQNDDVVEKDAAANGGKHRTASEIVVARLKSSAAVDPECVKISDMTAIGKNGDIEQFTVELKFK